ncbi:MAG: hypothetical protein GQ581_03325 [Methyloprofundus sp.]|nr:hypothetical protein [Methyloprofundus sp.]
MQVINLSSYFQKKQLTTRNVVDEVQGGDTELSANNIGFILHGNVSGNTAAGTRGSMNLDEYEQAMVA